MYYDRLSYTLSLGHPGLRKIVDFEVSVFKIHRLVVGCVLALLTLVLTSLPASAHTAFESSDPSDGALVDSSLDRISITFTGDSEETGDGFQVLDASGAIRVPTTVTTDDTRTFVLMFDPPLQVGVTAVRWMVKAPDKHPVEGSFTFTTTGAAPSSGVSDEGSAASGVVGDQAPIAAPAAPADEMEGMALDSSGQMDMSEFLASAQGSTDGAQKAAAIARILGLGGTMIGLGALVFAGTVLRGARRDIRYVLFWVRRSGVVVVAAALAELVAQVALENGGAWAAFFSPSALWSVVYGATGIAIALRMVGGAMLTSGAQLFTVDAEEVVDPVVALRELVGVGAHAGPEQGSHDPTQFGEVTLPSGHEHYVRYGDEAWDASSDSAGAFVGSALLIMSYLFDGHTLSKGDRLLTGLIDVVHVAAGAVWAGGVIMLVAVLWRRHLRGDEMRALQLAVRFSVVASVALVAVAVAGTALAVIVLDSPSELWSTPWGRLLMAKLAVVGVAAAGGGYNHQVVIPELNEMGDSQALADHFRTVVSIEAAALLLVIVITAFLVGAAS